MKFLTFLLGIMIAPAGWADQSHARHAHAAFGEPADAKQAKRSVRIAMSDAMRFAPAQITVKRGETLRFVPVNDGRVMHEMVLGTMHDLKAHAQAMRAQPGMAHDEPNMVHVAPGKSGELGWRFTRTGEFFYACLIPGHFEAGMVGRVKVIP
jgi:uncharacterized cupredoxin-like copper-binding protein